MPEEHRAWGYAEVILRSMGFTDWDLFNETKKKSLDVHRDRGIPEQ